MKKNSKILVSGSSGFVGKHLCRQLRQKGITVIANGGGDVDDGSTTKVRFDVTNLPQLLSIKEKISSIIHLAAKTSVKNSLHSPYDTYYTNLLGTLNLLEFARKKRVKKFINISTYVYGQPQYLPIDEKHPICPHSPYNKSKLLAEQLCEFYSHDFSIDIVTLRPFYLYGACPTPNSFIYNVLEQIVKRNGKVILSGELTKRDFLFIDDFLTLIENVLAKFPKGYNIYNVGYGKSYTLAEVSQIMAKLLNKKITIHHDNDMRPGDVVDMVADISKISNEFNWKPSTSLKQGLKLAV